MSKHKTLLDSPEFRKNSGYHDARADIENKRRNRALLRPGALFCLPKDEFYAEGYRSAWSEGGAK